MMGVLLSTMMGVLVIRCLSKQSQNGFITMGVLVRRNYDGCLGKEIRGALFRAWVYMVWVRRSDCSAPAR